MGESIESVRNLIKRYEGKLGECTRYSFHYNEKAKEASAELNKLRDIEDRLQADMKEATESKIVWAQIPAGAYARGEQIPAPLKSVDMLDAICDQVFNNPTLIMALRALDRVVLDQNECVAIMEDSELTVANRDRICAQRDQVVEAVSKVMHTPMMIAFRSEYPAVYPANNPVIRRFVNDEAEEPSKYADKIPQLPAEPVPVKPLDNATTTAPYQPQTARDLVRAEIVPLNMELTSLKGRTKEAEREMLAAKKRYDECQDLEKRLTAKIIRLEQAMQLLMG